jgi:hypothetical protein
MDDLAVQTSDAPDRNQIVAFGIVAVLVIGVTIGVLLFLNNRDDVEFDPIAGAELVPLDTHFYMTFNTDFTSDPWLAIPQLLNALGIEEEVRKDLRDSTDEEPFDYEKDIVSAIASIRRVGMAAQYIGSDEGELVVFIDSRDRQTLLDLFEMPDEDSTVREERDEELGLDFTVYVTKESGQDDFLVAVDNGIIYLSPERDDISNFIRRQRNQEPLSESVWFKNAIAEVSDDALIVGYGNGSIFDHRDFRDIVDAFNDSAALDPRASSVAFSITATTSGFGAGAVLNLDTGFGTLEQIVTQPADIDGLAALTPEDAIFFGAGAGLHDALVEGYATLEQDGRELLELYVYPFEDLAGLSFEHDLIPAIGSSYGFAFGAEDIDADEFDPESFWFLGLIESPEPSTLDGYVQTFIDKLPFECSCDIWYHPNYTTVQWPDTPLSDEPLADSPAFRRTLALLPPNPSTLYFVNLAAFPEGVIADISADLADDPDDYDVNLEAVLGFGIAGSADDTSFSLHIVLPINVPGTE